MEGASLAAVGQFLAEHIDAPDQLDILILLHSNPGKAWTSAEVSQAVYTVPAAALARLERLASHGLVRSDGAVEPRYQYSPTSSELAGRVERVAEAYSQDRAALIKHVLRIE